MRLVAIGSSFYLRKAIRVKAHYRRLPNGKTIYIQEHSDKRNAHKKDPKKFRGKVIHSDEESTTIVNHEGEAKKYKHKSHQELTQDDIHGKLNSAFHVDDTLAMKVWASEAGVD